MKRFIENDFITIRDMLGMNVSRKEIERVTGFSKSTIQRVARYKTWENYLERKEREKINQREREKTQPNNFIETLQKELDCQHCRYFSNKTGYCTIENKLKLEDNVIKCEAFKHRTVWLQTIHGNALCPFCGKEIELSDRDVFGYVKNNYNYCPACGKKMR